VFFTTSALAMVIETAKEELDYARTLKMSEWRVVYEVIIVGKLDQVLEIFRQSFAIAWMMLAMVEGVSRSEGGIGVMLADSSKHFSLPTVFAIQILIGITGTLFDRLIGSFRKFLCPHVALTLEKRK
jgi:NitT/TauT family transport system permease protein